MGRETDKAPVDDGFEGLRQLARETEALGLHDQHSSALSYVEVQAGIERRRIHSERS